MHRLSAAVKYEINFASIRSNYLNVASDCINHCDRYTEKIWRSINSSNAVPYRFKIGS